MESVDETHQNSTDTKNWSNDPHPVHEQHSTLGLIVLTNRIETQLKKAH